MNVIDRRLVVASVLVLLVATSVAPAVASTTPAASGLRLAKILGGYHRPVLVTHAPGGGRTIFIVEQSGRIKRATFEAGRWKKKGTFLDLSGKVNDPTKPDNGERGLLGLAFHPNYRANGLFYVNYTRRGPGGKRGDSVVAEYRRKDAGSARPGSRRVLMIVDQPHANHNGGHLAFGPDELLYLGFGDGGGSGDPDDRGQNKKSRLGKILRIDPRDPDGGGPKRFRIPSSNPRVGKSGRNDIWAWGLRNPWRFSFDRRNGNLWIGDVGQRTREEIDRSRSDANGRNAGKGRNYGWRRCEGTRRYPDTDQTCTFGTRPIYDYGHGSGRCSVTGGYVYRGPTKQAWRGLYVGGDFCGRLFVLNVKGKVKLSKVTDRNISSFGEDAAGRLFAADVVKGDVLIVRLVGPRP